MAQTCNSYQLPLPTLPMDCADDNYNYDNFGDKFFDLFEGCCPSIQADVAKMTLDNPLFDLYNLDDDIKPEIRNNDCMWSASNPADGPSTSASSSYSDSIATAMPLAAITGSGSSPPTLNGSSILRQQKQQQQPQNAATVVIANNNKLRQQLRVVDVKTEIKSEPIDDYEQQLQHHSILNSRTVQAQTQAQTQYQLQQQQQPESMQHIPPGTSLLRKSNMAQQQQQKKLQQQQKSLQLPRLYAGDYGRERDQLLTTTSSPIEGRTSSLSSVLCVRPDTPHSLDDDVATAFKHDIDLSACIMGSNNIPLTDHAHFISHVTQELQDTSKKQIDMPRLTHDNHSLSEVLDVIHKDTDSCYTSNLSMSHMRSDSESEDEESTGYGSCSSTLDDSVDLPTELSQDSNSSNGASHRSHHHQPSYLHSDHSYTRCKDGMEDLSHATLETPSDSDEEIDVVNICDKKLPTNPSDKDRRALQTKVAHKISNARIVKTANGLKTIPRRRNSFDLPYTPTSNSPVKSVSNSSYPSPASTPYQNQYTSKYINVISEKSRKRMSGIMTVGGSVINDIEYSLPPSKKNRGKKTKLQVVNTVPALSPTAGLVLKRHLSLDEAADTIEKRNLHNDMERQRRIGLKNLFESLKKQIPSIKDKERAPKVNILREAAKLCEALTREDHQLNEQKTKLTQQLRKRQELLSRLTAAQRD